MIPRKNKFVIAGFYFVIRNYPSDLTEINEPTIFLNFIGFFVFTDNF